MCVLRVCACACICVCMSGVHAHMWWLGTKQIFLDKLADAWVHSSAHPEWVKECALQCFNSAKWLLHVISFLGAGQLSLTCSANTSEPLANLVVAVQISMNTVIKLLILTLKTWLNFKIIVFPLLLHILFFGKLHRREWDSLGIMDVVVRILLKER